MLNALSLRCKSALPSNAPRNEHGVAMVEGAIAFSFLLIFFLIAINLIQIAYQSYFVEHALRQTARGAQLSDRWNNDGPANLRTAFIINSEKYGIEVDADELRICPFDQPFCSTDYAPSVGELFYLGYSMPAQLSLLHSSYSINLGAISRRQDS